ncbi:MAG: phosphate-starvation-inducible PsiE family protein [Streptosporangiaceae bacterium]
MPERRDDHDADETAAFGLPEPGDPARRGPSGEPGPGPPGGPAAAGSAPPAAGAEGARRPWTGRPLGRRIGETTSVLERSQDVVTVSVGVILVLLAAVLLIAGIYDFFAHALSGPHPSVFRAAASLLDSVLLVLILVEIVHTVVLSLRQHRLAAQPFIVVGLVAVIRRILLVLTPGVSDVKLTTSELALLIGMIAVFITGLIVVSRYAREDE